MLTKIIYKNFRSNLKNYILFFLSNIVAIMELFVFYGIRSIIKSSITDKGKRFNFRHGYKNPRPHSCSRSTLTIHI